MHHARFALVVALAGLGCGGEATKPREPEPAPLAVYDAGSPADAGPKVPPSASETAASTLRTCMAADPRDLEIAFDFVREAKPETLAPGLARALWDCFAQYRPSKSKSIRDVKTIAELVRATRHPSYGPLATTMIKIPVVDPRSVEEGMDEIQFHQNIAIQIVGDLGYRPAVPALVVALVTPAKHDLMFPLRLALAKMPDAAEPALIAALEGRDADARRASDTTADCTLGLGLGAISRPAGRNAIVAALARATDDQARACLALALPGFPADPGAIEAYRKAYAKISTKTTLAILGGSNARATLIGTMAGFFDPKLVAEITSAVRSAKGDFKDEVFPVAVPAAVKLMMPEDRGAVAAIATAGIEKDMFTAAAGALDQCKKNVACWLAILDEPTPKSPVAKMRLVKAAWMTAMLSTDATRTELLVKLAKSDDGTVRFAILEAIDHLSPKGDVATATTIDTIVAHAQSAGDLSGMDEAVRIALRLRARALPSP